MFGVGRYKTRDGQDVEIVAVAKDVAIGYMNDDPENTNTWNAKTGNFFLDRTESHRLDLIDPNAKKPIKQYFWATVYKSRSGGGVFIGTTYGTRREAKENRCKDCIAIARVEIDCMEGDGLD